MQQNKISNFVSKLKIGEEASINPTILNMSPNEFHEDLKELIENGWRCGCEIIHPHPDDNTSLYDEAFIKRTK